MSRRDFSHTCTACDNTWRYEDQFGKKFSESCDLNPRSPMLMPIPACTGYCENKDENGKQQNHASIDLGECSPAGWTSTKSNIGSNRRVHWQQQRQPLLFAKTLRAHLVFDAQHGTLLRWGRGAVPILLLVDAYLQEPK